MKEVAPVKPVDTAQAKPAAEVTGFVAKEEAPKAEVKAEPKVEAKVEPKVEAKPEVKAEAAKPAAKPATSTGKVKVQLGAYKSEAEAKAEWAKMQKKYSGLAGRTPTIVKADLGEKGVFYRLRTGNFGTANEAKLFCATLKGQACIIPTN